MRAILVCALSLVAVAAIGQLVLARTLSVNEAGTQDGHVFVVNGFSVNVSITIDQEETVASLKDAIEDAIGTPKDLQTLVFNGELLEDERSLSYHGIKSGSTVTLHKRYKSDNVIKLKVKVFGAQDSKYTTTIEISDAETVKKFKDIIAQEIGIAASEQKLFVREQELDNWTQLGCIKQDETVRIEVDGRIDPRLALKMLKARPKVLGKISVKTLTGETITVDSDPSDTVAQLKNKIMEKAGFREDQQRLIFDGKQLEDEQQLSHYGISQDSNLNLVVRDEIKLKVKVIASEGSEFLTTVEVDPKVSIRGLKEAIERETSIDSSTQKLFLWGHELEGWRYLEEYYPVIRDGAQIKLTVDGTIEIDELDKAEMRQSGHLMPREKFERFFGSS